MDVVGAAIGQFNVDGQDSAVPVNFGTLTCDTFLRLFYSVLSNSGPNVMLLRLASCDAAAGGRQSMHHIECGSPK